MDDERRQKIEAGKLKLAEFKKKRYKKTKTKTIEKPPTESIANQLPEENLISMEISCDTVLDPPPTDTVNLVCAESESISQQPEVVSDDASHFENANCEMLSLCSEKIEIYQVAIKHRDDIIQKLSNRLASTMSANEAADSAGSEEIKNLKQEINLLHQQMKEAAEMLERQKSRIPTQEESQQTSDDGDMPSFSWRHQSKMTEMGTQVESFLPHPDSPDNVEPLETLLSRYSETPNLPQRLCDFLKSAATPDELQSLTKDLFKLDTSTGDKVLEEDISHQTNDLPAMLKRIQDLNCVAKLIESLLSTSVKTSESTGNFSCSKFQSFFLKRMNSTEEEPEISENESTVSDINYAEVLETSLAKGASEFPSIENLRSTVVEEFSLVADFLMEEMEKISASVPPGSPGPQGDSALTGTGDLVVTELKFREVALQKSKLEGRLNNLRRLEEKMKETFYNFSHQPTTNPQNPLEQKMN